MSKHFKNVYKDTEKEKSASDEFMRQWRSRIPLMENVAKLEAENAKFRSALEEIADFDEEVEEIDKFGTIHTIRNIAIPIARAALTPTTIED